MFGSLRSRLVLGIGTVQVVTWLVILGIGGVHMWNELDIVAFLELVPHMPSTNPRRQNSITS